MYNHTGTSLSLDHPVCEPGKKNVAFNSDVECRKKRKQPVEDPSTHKEIGLHKTVMHVASCWQEGLLVGLRVGDLIDDNSHAALRDDVGTAVADLNADNRMCSIDAHHGEQVHHRICAPTDHCPHLCSSDLSGDNWVSLVVGGLCKSIEELIHNVQEEDHGDEPASPTWCQVTGDNKLAVVARGNHESRTHTKVPSLAAECCVIELHHETDLNQEQGHSQEPIHVTIGVVECPC